MAPRQRREVHTHPNTLVEPLRALGTDAPRTADERGLGAHTHPSDFEICYIHSGCVAWWAEDGVYEVGPGQLYITWPDELHGGVHAILHRCHLFWALVRLPRGGALRGLTRAEGRGLADAFHGMAQRCFPAPDGTRTRWDRLLHEHREPGPWRAVVARAVLHEFLCAVLRAHDAHVSWRAREEARLSETSRAAMDWMRAHLHEDFGLEDVAAHVGLSVSRLHERFRQDTGFSPADWRNRERVERAKALLRRNERSIAEVAFACGFRSSQYFATAFRRLMGMPPAEYRARMRCGEEGGAP